MPDKTYGQKAIEAIKMLEDLFEQASTSTSTSSDTLIAWVKTVEDPTETLSNIVALMSLIDPITVLLLTEIKVRSTQEASDATATKG